MAATPGRIVCPRCGENNFDTQANCWKCGSPLRGSGVSPARPTAPVPPASAAPASLPPAPVFAAAATPSVDPAIAVWSAIALAVLFPYVAVPAGIVFLMLDDRRKAEIGRIALLWGIAATILHTLFSFLLLRQTMTQAMVLMQAFGRGLPSASGSGPASDSSDLNSPAEPLRLPGDIAVPGAGGPSVKFPDVPSSVRQP